MGSNTGDAEAGKKAKKGGEREKEENKGWERALWLLTSVDLCSQAF